MLLHFKKCALLSSIRRPFCRAIAIIYGLSTGFSPVHLVLSLGILLAVFRSRVTIAQRDSMIVYKILVYSNFSEL